MSRWWLRSIGVCPESKWGITLNYVPRAGGGPRLLPALPGLSFWKFPFERQRYHSRVAVRALNSPGQRPAFGDAYLVSGTTADTIVRPTLDFDLDPATDLSCAFLHARQAHSAGVVKAVPTANEIARTRTNPHSCACVLDRQLDAVLICEPMALQLDLCHRALGMPRDIGQRLLHHAEQDQFDIIWQPIEVARDLKIDSIPLRSPKPSTYSRNARPSPASSRSGGCGT